MLRNSLAIRLVLIVVVLVSLAMALGTDPWGPG
jgi:hypothetical protein